PALAAGWQIDPDAGHSSATRRSSELATSYTVTVTDGQDATATAALSLGVTQPALGLTLSEASASLTRGTAMTAITATPSGGDEGYSVDTAPPQPRGLQIDTDTGTISG